MFTEMNMSRKGGRHLGYWAAYPKDTLPHPGDFVDASWDPEEREAVAVYLDSHPAIQYWKGYSSCRLCGEIGLGSTDRSDGVYTWPEGFSHYITVHNVKPPQEFIDHVLTYWRISPPNPDPSI